MPERWYWLDWLRLLAMGTIFLFHSSMPFSYFPWNINDPTPNLGFSVFVLFLMGWAMPLFFVISGISVYFSLARRSASQFVKDRLQRLMIPFVFVGLLVVLSVNGYYDAVFHGKFTGDFVHFYFGSYFTKFFPFDTKFSPTYFANSNQGVYLWYLFWLFVFSLVTVHFFKWLMKEGNRNKLSRLYAVCNRRGGILLLAVPLIAVNVAAVPPFFVFPTVYGGWKLPTHLVFFITAYVMASNPQFEEAVVKSRVSALLLGIVTSFLAIGSLLIALADPSGMPSHYLSVSTFWALNGWCWVVAILGYGRKHLSFNNKFLETSNELVLPFYILHQSVIVAIAFYVVSTNLVVAAKFLLIMFTSFPIIVALLYPISKINLLRVLFGMRMKNRSL
jgi:glucan biosynthesis protein C